MRSIKYGKRLIRKGATMKQSPKYQPNNLNYQHFLLVNLLRSYIKVELDEITSFHSRVAAEEIALDDWFIYVIEIAYHIGYAYSLLKQKISEVTYKNMKKLVKDNLLKRLSGGENAIT
jgi:hypothetical protein